MTSLAKMITTARSPSTGPTGAMPRCLRPVTTGGRMVREEDAAALVADVAQALALRGHDVKITPENGPRLIQRAALLLFEFGIVRGGQGSAVRHESEESSDRAAERDPSDDSPPVPV